MTICNKSHQNNQFYIYLSSWKSYGTRTITSYSCIAYEEAQWRSLLDWHKKDEYYFTTGKEEFILWSVPAEEYRLLQMKLEKLIRNIKSYFSTFLIVRNTLIHVLNLWSRMFGIVPHRTITGNGFGATVQQ